MLRSSLIIERLPHLRVVETLITSRTKLFRQREGDMAAELEIIDRSEEWAMFLKKKYKTELNKLAREYPHTKSLGSLIFKNEQ